MPTLILPSFAVTNMVNANAAGAMFSTNTGATNASYISGSQGTNISLLIIYKGTIENFATFTDRATRSADVLITFTLPAAAGVTELGIVSNAYRALVGKHLPNQVAAASGVASWFLLCRSGTTTLTDKGALMGSIGITGSGADLEVPDTNIVLGNNYQSAGFYLNMPQTWVF